MSDLQKRRKSIRLSGYDYSLAGGYFVTICVKNRVCLLGDIVDETMKLFPEGETVLKAWLDLENHYPHVELDELVIMSNHVHGIIFLTEEHPAGDDVWDGVGDGLRPSPGVNKRHGLPEIVRAFKSFSARRINEMRNTPGISFWQRGYYDHIIRNERSLNAIRLYIRANPLNWHLDRENPGNF